MAKNSQGLAARVTKLEKAFAKMLSGREAKAKKGKKSPTTKVTKSTATKNIKRKTAKSSVAAPTSARSRKKPEHGIFPDSPPIFAVDEADAKAALGIKK